MERRQVRRTTPPHQRQQYPSQQQRMRQPNQQYNRQPQAMMHRPTYPQQYNPRTDVQRYDDVAPRMVCPRCRSTHITAQVINEISLKTKHKSFIWWIFVGWWWVPLKWIVLTVPAIIVKLFRPKRYKTVNKAKTYKVCQNCGYTWQ